MKRTQNWTGFGEISNSADIVYNSWKFKHAHNKIESLLSEVLSADTKIKFMRLPFPITHFIWINLKSQDNFVSLNVINQKCFNFCDVPCPVRQITCFSHSFNKSWLWTLCCDKKTVVVHRGLYKSQSFMDMFEKLLMFTFGQHTLYVWKKFNSDTLE